MPSDDYELLNAWRSGDQHAGNELVRRNFSSLSRFFRNKVDDGVADLMQRTFLACVESRDRIPEGLAFKVYLLGISRRVLAQHYREKKRHGPTAVGASRLIEAANSPSAHIAARQEQQLLLRALRQLPLDLQLVVELFYWEELKTADIGHVLEIPPGTVKSRLHRAKELLREAVHELAADEAVARSTIGNLDRWARSLRRYLDRGPDSMGTP